MISRVSHPVNSVTWETIRRTLKALDPLDFHKNDISDYSAEAYEVLIMMQEPKDQGGDDNEEELRKIFPTLSHKKIEALWLDLHPYSQRSI